MKMLVAVLLTTTPAFAAGGPFISLGNTDFVVLIAFLAFVGVLVYMKVPGMLTGMLDARAAGIKADLEEAKALREEARALLSSYEKKQKEVQEQSAHRREHGCIRSRSRSATGGYRSRRGRR